MLVSILSPGADMQKLIRAVIVVIATAIYLTALRLLVSSEQPYYILGIGLVGLASWLMGAVSGMVVALLLIPLTDAVYGNYVISRDFIKLAGSPPYIAMQVLAAVGMGLLRKEKKYTISKEAELEEANERLQTVLSQVKELGGVHSFCGTCKKIMDDQGNWQNTDQFLKTYTKMEFSHCMCPDCAEDFRKANDDFKDQSTSS